MSDINLAKRLLGFLDLTSLNDDDSEISIKALCQQANTELGKVAAVCVYPQFVPLVKNLISGSGINIATVANFPHANDPIETVIRVIQQAIADGANEIDIVMPYRDYLKGKHSDVENFITQCKEACGNKLLLKIILETGALELPTAIANASRDAIEAGADFIKTSTGKISINATPEAARIMLKTIHEMKPKRTVGFKASGGIRTLEQATKYLHLAEEIMGKSWVSAKTFRIGTSRLVEEMLQQFTNFKPTGLGSTNY